MTDQADYIMGVSDAEFERLKLQGAYLEPVTRRLIREAGIREGMRVLDIGCGMGDVTLLLAEAVGPSGQVVALDREEKAIAGASARLADRRNVIFRLSSVEDFGEPAAFDAAFGRYVLFHQTDPAAMLRRAAAAVRPGGVIAFHEMVVSVDPVAVPPLDLWGHVVRIGFEAVRAVLPGGDTGAQLIPIFEDAGLGTPDAFFESLSGGWQSLAIPWLAMSYRTVAPIIAKLGIDARAVGDPDTLEERLAAAAEAARTQFILNPQGCAWAVRPA